VDITADYDLLHRSVGLFERAGRTKLCLGGAEAAEFLQGQVTNDVEGLAPGRGCYAALLNHKGKMRADMRILRAADGIWIDSEPAARELLVKTVRMYSIGRDVSLRDVTDDYATLSLIGPEARAALDVEPPVEEHAFVDGAHGRYVTTDLGVDVICRTPQAAAVRAALGVDAVSEAAVECVRIETGRPRHGTDATVDTIPEEAGLNERAVSFTKGCYVGQETVARLHYKGKPNRTLRGLSMSAAEPPGADVRSGDRQVGTLGSTAVSPVHGPIALAILRREVGPGDIVSVGSNGTTAEVVALPFASARTHA
jgi:tRNA-modifying protein YgfZ